MDVLRYNELDVAGLTAQVDRVEQFLREGDFRAADVKKMTGTPFYRAKLNAADRLLFRFAHCDDATYLLLLEVIRHHQYERSRFLRGGTVDENKLPPVSKADDLSRENCARLVYVNRQLRHFHLMDKIISMDDIQHEVFSLRPPLVLIGSAGSGKTVLTIEKLKQLGGDILYVTLSPYLAENARNLYYANGYDNENQNLDFMAYSEFLESIRMPSGRPVTYQDFAAWCGRREGSHRIGDNHQLFEEIHGVLTGTAVDSPFLSRADYKALGIRQSIFRDADRDAVYDLFERYLVFLRTEGLYNPNMAAYEHLALALPKYDFVVADEVQDLTNVQIHLALKTLRNSDNFILCGDANQIVHPNFFSWAHVKSLFYERRGPGRPNILRVLDANYRNTPEVINLANRLLLIKHARFGSIDRESNYLIRSVTNESGEAAVYRDEESIRRELNSKTSRSARTAVIVMRPEEKADARRHFQTPLVFSIREAKGLEYDTIILLNIVSGNPREFDALIEGVAADDLKRESLKYSRARDKSDKSLEAYKFFVNSFYVGITRAVKNLYILERNPTHRVFELMGCGISKDTKKVKSQQSSSDDWKQEAHKLEMQGKKEQADEIRRLILEERPVPWPVLTPHNLENLKREALNPERFNRQAKLLLFEYAAVHQVHPILYELMTLKFNQAVHPERHQASLQHKYYAAYRAGDVKAIRKQIESYGVDYRNQLNQTPLMIAAQFGMRDLAQWLIHNGANPRLTDNWGRIPLQIALREAYRSSSYANEKIGDLYDVLAPAFLRVACDERLIKIDGKRMEFFLVHSMLALLQDILRDKIQWNLPAFQTGDFVFSLEHFPDYVIPPNRKQRRYLTSVLARNEVDSTDPNSRKLFVRVQRGYYIINPSLELEIDGKWVNVYDMIHIDELANEKNDRFLTEFTDFVRQWRQKNQIHD